MKYAHTLLKAARQTGQNRSFDVAGFFPLQLGKIGLHGAVFLQNGHWCTPTTGAGNLNSLTRRKFRKRIEVDHDSVREFVIRGWEG